VDVRVETASHPVTDGEVRLLGAVHSVTGAMTRVDVAGTKLLVDCGVAQGREARRWSFPEDALDADAVVLTHGHNDHVGSLPEMWRRGFTGPVIGTAATLAIARIVLADGLRLQRARKDVRPFLAWLAERSREVPYDELGAHAGGADVRFAFREAGHIIGSASVEIVTSRSRVIVSGDLGRPGMPILRDPNTRWNEERAVDLVVLESTYGDREHRDDAGVIEQKLRDVIEHAQASKGHILVPAFAIGRTQTLLWHLNALVESGQVQDIPVAVDTPMGLHVTDTYRRFERLYDRDALDRIARGDAPLDFDELYAVRKGRDSARLRDVPGPMLVIAGSGMCTGGRIVGHLSELLPRESTVLLFVGYQAPGTPGRAIQEAGEGGTVRLDGEEVRIAARIETLSGLSAHADRGELVEWIRAVPRPRAVALHHGEPDAQRGLAVAIGRAAG
jgi:metallo-beta-lactamase family protein